MEKMFEIICNGEGFGIYPGIDKAAAIEAQAIDAGYESFADMLNTTGQTQDDFLAEMKVVEVEVKGISIDLWEREKVAIYFSLYLDGEKTRSLEWVDSDGDLEMTASHIDSAHDFSGDVKDYIRCKLNAYLSKHQNDVSEYYEMLSE